MAGQSGVADAHLGYLGKGGLEGGQQLRLHLPRYLLGSEILADVAADVGVEQHGVFQPDAVFTEAADADVYVDARALVHHPEGDGAGRAVLVAGQLLGVEIVDALVLWRLAAEGEALADVLKHALDGFAQVTGKEARLRGRVVGVFARLGAHIHDPALLHDKHALAVCHSDDGAVGDDVVIALGVAGAARDLLLSLQRQNFRGYGLAVEEFLPLIGQYASGCPKRGFDKSHGSFPLSSICRSGWPGPPVTDAAGARSRRFRPSYSRGRWQPP